MFKPDRSLTVPEYIDIGPTGQIEMGAVRKEIETCLCKLGAPFALKPDGKFCMQAMEIAHIARRIILLRF